MSATGGSLLGVSVLELRTDQRALDAGLVSARTKADRAGMDMQRSMDRRMVSLGQSMGRAGSALTTHVTVPILALAGAAADAATHFQQAMEMIHTQAGASQREVKNLSGAILDLARSGKVAAGPNQLADALFRLEGAGLRGKKAMDALTASAQLAAVGNANVEDTAKTLAQTWFVGIKGAGSFKETVAELNATVGAGDLRLQQLVDALGTGVLTSAKQAGLSLHDVTGALAVFGDETNNVSGFASQFATSLHFLTNPTKKATDALATLGLGSDQLSADLHKPNGLVTALSDLKTRLEALPGGLTGVRADRVLGDIFPAGRGRVLEILLNQLDRLKSKMGQIQHTHDQFAADVAKTEETAAFRIHSAWAKIEADAIEVGGTVLPLVLGKISGVADDVDKVVSAFSKLPKGAQDLILTGGLVLAGVGPALKLLGVFTSGAGKLWGAAQIAARLAATGTFRAPATAVGAAGHLSTTVATMEVGTLIARGVIGGAGGSVGVSGLKSGEKVTSGGVILPAGVGRAEEVAAAGGGAVEAGLASRLLGAGARVLGVAGLAALAAPIAIPLVGALIKALQGESYGQKLADALTRGFAPQVRKTVAGALDDAHKQLSPTPVPGTTGMTLGAAEANRLGRPTTIGASRDQIARAVAEQRKAGGDIAAALAKGWAQYKFQSEPLMLTQLHAELKAMPPQTQAAGIQSAISFARGLETQGKLPRGAWQRMLAGVNALFPGWQHQLGAWASLSAVTFTRQLDFTRAERNMKQALDRMRGDFPEVTQAMDTTAGSIIDKSASVVQALEGIVHGPFSTADMRTKATADLKALRKSVTDDLTHMADLTASKAGDMRDALAHGSQQAASIASANFSKLADNIATAVSSGTISTAAGAKMIADALNAVLKSFGEKALPAAKIKSASAATLAGLASGQTSSFIVGQGAGTPRGHLASGGVVQIGRPNDVGPDSVPLNVGGKDIVVAPGETVAVLNRWQRPVLDRALAREGYGGLAGMFRKIRRPHNMATGGIVPGFQGGGVSYGQLEGLWDRAGGDPKMAALMAAIAEAESTGNPNARNPSGASGLWQILGVPFPGNPFDPLTNARMALAKYRSQGLGAWATYTSGAFRQFLRGAVPPLGGAGLAGSIHPPTVDGDGTIPSIVRGALKLAARGANSYLSAHAAGAGAGGAIPGVTGPGGLGTLDGLPVSNWIIPILQWARGHGWAGSVTSGYRNASQQLSAAEGYGLSRYGSAGPLGSNHTKIGYPGGAVDVSDPSQLAAVLRGYSGHPNLVWGGPVMGDTVHFSATGHQRGGLLFAQNGLLGHAAAAKPRSSIPPKRKAAPKQKGKLPKELQPLSMHEPLINRSLKQLSGMLSDHGTVAKLSDEYQATDSLFQATHPDLQYVVTPSDGSAPFIDQNAVATSLAELNQLYGWETQIRDTYAHAVKLIKPLMARLRIEIAKRQKRIAEIKAKILENLRHIAALTAQIARIKRAGTLDSRQSLPYPNAKTAAHRAANRSFEDERKHRGWARSDAITALGTTITGLKTENQKLGGDHDKIGTGGALGVELGDVKQLSDRLTTAGQYRDDTVGVSGIGGNLNDANVTLADLSNQIAELSPDALKQALAAAGGGTAVSPDTSQLASLLQTQNTTLSQELAVSQAQYKVLAALPPFGGSFATGGIVPGLPGEARTIIAHGGERITPVGGDDSRIRVRVEDHRIRVWRDDVEQIIEQKLRTTARRAGRRLPGTGGGV